MSPPFIATAYAYPWDIVGDPLAAERIRELGVDSVTLAAAYHSVRAATPRHPEHRIVDAASAASYLPVRDAVWRGQRLAPRGAEEWAGPDSFARARDVLEDEGLVTNAWVVATHNSRLGRLAPDLCVANAFGDAYRYALCPSNGEVRTYVTTLVGEVAVVAAVDSIVVEASGPLGVAHQSQHEKTAGAGWTATDEALLSICFCRTCRAAYVEHQVDPDALALTVRHRVGSGVTGMADALGDYEPMLRSLRFEQSVGLRNDVIAAAHANGVARVSFHATLDPWATGPAAAIVDRGGAVETYVVDCWPGQPEGVDRVTGMVDAVSAVSAASAPSTPSGASATSVTATSVTSAPSAVGAYCTVLSPGAVEPDRFAADWGAFLRAGARELHLYHSGLASTPRLAAAADALGELRGGQLPGRATTPEHDHEGMHQ